MTIFYYLRSDAYSSAWAKVTGKRCNLGDGEGMQVLCKLRNLSSDIYLVFLFPFFRVEISSYPKELPSEGPKNGSKKQIIE